MLNIHLLMHFSFPRHNSHESIWDTTDLYFFLRTKLGTYDAGLALFTRNLHRLPKNWLLVHNGQVERDLNQQVLLFRKTHIGAPVK